MRNSSRKWALLSLLVLGGVQVVLLNAVLAPRYVRELATADDARSASAATPGRPARDAPSAAAEPAGAARSTDAPLPLARASTAESAAPAAATTIAAAAPSGVPASPATTAAVAAAPASPAAPPAEVPVAATGAGPGALPQVVTTPQPKTDAGRAAIYFETRSSGLGPDERKALWAIGKKLLADPSARVSLRGHADERGDAAFNDWLAERRARVAAAFLISLGVPADRIAVTGLGAAHPADSGGSAEALAQNRRVEIEWTK